VAYLQLEVVKCRQVGLRVLVVVAFDRRDERVAAAIGPQENLSKPPPAVGPVTCSWCGLRCGNRGVLGRHLKEHGLTYSDYAQLEEAADEEARS
jgi:hypothetical protein